MKWPGMASGRAQSQPGEPEPDDFWCELVKDTSVEPDTIGRLTGLAREIAQKNGGEFDGWACPVMK
jgi:hypothetical protein